MARPTLVGALAGAAALTITGCVVLPAASASSASSSTASNSTAATHSAPVPAPPRSPAADPRHVGFAADDVLPLSSRLAWETDESALEASGWTFDAAESAPDAGTWVYNGPAGATARVLQRHVTDVPSAPTDDSATRFTLAQNSARGALHTHGVPRLGGGEVDFLQSTTTSADERTGTVTARVFAQQRVVMAVVVHTNDAASLAATTDTFLDAVRISTI